MLLPLQTSGMTRQITVAKQVSEDATAIIQAQMASMGNIRRSARLLLNNSGAEPEVECNLYCIFVSGRPFCYYLCDGPIEIGFTNRITRF